MIAAQPITAATPLRNAAPPVRGLWQADAPLARLTWFGVGGAADALFTPADADDLQAFLRRRDAPVTVLGAGSNLLARDGGVAGVTIRLGKAFARIRVEADGLVIAGAAASDAAVARAAAAQGLAGLEFYSGIPGWVGGAARMNAGCYGGETAAALVAITVLEPSGERRTLSAAALRFGYRHSALPEGAIVIEAKFRGTADDPTAILVRMAEIQRQRRDSQPIGVRTGGSTFRNPDGHKAWRLLDAAGCRGLRRGGARFSDKHCNFLLNDGSATAADLEALGEEARNRVWKRCGIALHWEIERIGRR